MRAKKQLGSIVSLAILGAISLSIALAQSGGSPSKLFELRLYTANAGKLLHPTFNSEMKYLSLR